MMKKHSVLTSIFSFIFLIVLSSCNRNNKMEQEMTNFTGKHIIFPDSLNINNLDSFNTGCKLVIWFDSTECNSCKINRLYSWDNTSVIQLSQAMKDKFKVYVIFSPKKDEIRPLKVSLRKSNYLFPLFVDETSEFAKINPHIPSDKRLHSFLLDKDNKIVLLGNPIENDKLWELYKKQIQELTR